MLHLLGNVTIILHFMLASKTVKFSLAKRLFEQLKMQEYNLVNKSPKKYMWGYAKLADSLL